MESISVQQKILSRNDEIAAGVRRTFDGHGLYVVNLISSPGSGKTSLLERILPVLGRRFRILEGFQKAHTIGSGPSIQLCHSSRILSTRARTTATARASRNEASHL